MSDEGARRLEVVSGTPSSRPRRFESYLLDSLSDLLKEDAASAADRSTAGLPFIYRVTVSELRDAALHADLRAAILERSPERDPESSAALRRRIRVLRLASSEIRSSIARILEEMRE